MDKEDYYKLLNVDRNASDSELKKSYKRMAMKFHPDRNKGNPEAEKKFKNIKEAYEVLSDQKKRSAYDQFGHAGVDSRVGGDASGFGGGNFSDIFGDIFGGGGRQSNANRGADLNYNMELSLEKAVAGSEVKIRISVNAACGECHGTGAKKGSKPITCNTCHGHGNVRMQQGFFSVQQTCPNCQGTGQQINNPCRKCSGQGLVQENKTLSVKVPAGVDTGDRIRLGGEGEAGVRGTQAGDLYVQIHVKEHAIFTRDGANLFCEVPISFPTACVGGDLEVPTLNGKVKLKIPAETQTGKLFRLRNKGVKQVRGGAVGDLLCKVQVETPVRLTKDQKFLVSQLSDSLAGGGEQHSPQEHFWTDGVKSFFEKLTR